MTTKPTESKYTAWQFASHIKTTTDILKNKPFHLYTFTYSQLNKKSTRVYEEVYCIVCACAIFRNRANRIGGEVTSVILTIVEDRDFEPLVESKDYNIGTCCF